MLPPARTTCQVLPEVLRIGVATGRQHRRCFSCRSPSQPSAPLVVVQKHCETLAPCTLLVPSQDPRPRALSRTQSWTCASPLSCHPVLLGPSARPSYDRPLPAAAAMNALRGRDSAIAIVVASGRGCTWRKLPRGHIGHRAATPPILFSDIADGGPGNGQARNPRAPFKRQHHRLGVGRQRARHVNRRRGANPMPDNSWSVLELSAGHASRHNSHHINTDRKPPEVVCSQDACSLKLRALSPGGSGA